MLIYSEISLNQAPPVTNAALYMIRSMKAKSKSVELVINESVHLIPASITVKRRMGIAKREVIIHPPCKRVAELAANVPTEAIPMQPTRITR